MDTSSWAPGAALARIVTGSDNHTRGRKPSTAALRSGRPRLSAYDTGCRAGQRRAGVHRSRRAGKPVAALIGTDLAPATGPAPAEPVAGNGDACRRRKCAGTRPGRASAGGLRWSWTARRWAIPPMAGQDANRRGPFGCRRCGWWRRSAHGGCGNSEVNARTHLHIEMPGLAARRVVPTYAAAAASSHAVADGVVDSRKTSPGRAGCRTRPLTLQASASYGRPARSLTDQQLAEPVCGDRTRQSPVSSAWSRPLLQGC